ncbi:MAG: acyclic terpene utilization AtuA family protein [Roseovarius indicus]
MSRFATLRAAFAEGRRRPIRIVGASGQLGYGVPTAAFEAALARDPDMIGCDMGSLDIGPYYLGSGEMAVSRASARRDLRKVLVAARRLDIPLVIGSAGSAGAAPHLDGVLELIREIAAEDGLTFRLASIPADIDREACIAAIEAGGVRSLDGMPELSPETVRGATHLVAQMGMEAFQRAFEAGADVIVAGRACDTGIFAAMPILLGFPEGLAIHLAKIVECASVCCVPGGRDPILATLDDEGFELESMNPDRAATPSSVAAHSLYEQSDPFSILEPAGRVDLSEVTYAALDARRTRAEGARFVPTDRYCIKLEGAAALGHRSILLAASADPSFIANTDEIAEGLEALVESLVCEGQEKDYRLIFRFYGKDGVRRPVVPHVEPGEIGVVVECLAPTEARATEVLRTAKQYLLHFGFPGRKSTAGNLAFPFTPPEIYAGRVYELTVFHLMDIAAPEEVFPVRVEEV